MRHEGNLSITRSGDGALIVRLAGGWRLEAGLPPLAPVEREIHARTTRTLAFDTRELGSWDSALVTFLAEVSALCRARGIAMDQGGLPPGVRRLLELAEAVPEAAGARRTPLRASWLAHVGTDALAVWRDVREALVFLGELVLSLGRLVRGRARFRRLDLFVIVQSCSAEALPIVTLISVLVGMILAFVGAVQLTRFGAQIYVADLVAIAMVREMGCIMTGIIMAGRTGSGFAAQIGTMRVTQEIDALTTLGIPPMDFLVLPRVVALSLMMPLLTVYANVLGIAGGALVSVGMLDVTLVQYVNESNTAVTLTSYATGIGKSVVFGVLVALSGCLRGMQSGKSSSAVGDAATSAVVTGIVLIIVADGIFAVVFHVLGI
ncbi:MAG: ABC transporter permease [Deltaproteobacteria bacterium]|nr:MAG: ABC transporter permease [Deltaproteobacteria bacterium]